MNIPYEFHSDEARNKWLLYHYLKKSYTDIGILEHEAEELTDKRIIENSKNLFGFHGLAWELGAIDLEFFVCISCKIFIFQKKIMLQLQ